MGSQEKMMEREKLILRSKRNLPTKGG